MYIKKIVNIIDSVADLHIGIWQPLLVSAELFEKQGVVTEIWARTKENNINVFNKLKKNYFYRTLPFAPSASFGSLKKNETIIVTHGAWRYPTWWGYVFAKAGFLWCYTPHGMLEPWSMAEKSIKKYIYFDLIERILVQNANAIRAVSENEARNLATLFYTKYIKNIYNSISIAEPSNLENNYTSIRRVLFLGRLHHKKGVRQLVEAWAASSLAGRKDYELMLVGQDEGELKYVTPYLSSLHNIKYEGVLFGKSKADVLKDSTFFILPSQSEGLPSALLESLAAGLIPIVSEGCNVSQIFEQKIGYKVAQDTESIKKTLDLLPQIDDFRLLSLRERARHFFNEHFGSAQASEQLLNFYEQICQQNSTQTVR